MAAVAPFSYAQAAKGKSTSSTPQSLSQGKKESFNWADDSADAATVVEDIQSPSSASGRLASTDLEQSPSKPRLVDEKFELSHASSPDFGASSASTAKEDDAHSDTKPSADGPWESKSQVSNNQSQPQEAVGEHRGRSKSKRGKDKKTQEHKEETIEAPPPKPLKEAPVPTVNIWQQRAQEAKAKPSSLQPSPKSSISSAPTGGKDSSNPTSSAGTAIGGTNDKPQKTGVQAPRQGKLGRSNSEDLKTSGAGAQGLRTARFSSVEPSQRSAPLPSVRDETSWPTVESAQDEERRKAQEKEDKTAEKDRSTAPANPHGKTQWKEVPYTPTVKFNTPLPPTRGRGGGRLGLGGRGGRGGAFSDRGSVATGAETAVPDAKARDRGEAAARSSSLPPNSRRPHAANQSREQTSHESHSQRKQQSVQATLSASARKATASTSAPGGVSEELAAPEEAKRTTASAGDQSLPDASDEVHVKPDTKQASDLTASHRKSVPLQVDGIIETAPAQAQQKKRRGSQSAAQNEMTTGEYPERRRFATENAVSEEKQGWQEPRGEAPVIPRGSHKESWSGMSPRERTEGRPERGGKPWAKHAGRGSAQTMHQNHNGSHLSPIQTSAAGQGYYGHPSNASFNPRGNFRGGPRSSSISTDASYGRYNPGVSANGQYAYSPYGNGMYDYSMVPMSAGPYSNAYMDPTVVVAEIARQLAFYFSMDNLLKDMYLRKHMDSQGFVTLSLIANFKKMKDLTTDVELVKFVCMQSEDLEIRIGLDGKDRIRKRQGWETFVLVMDERDPSAKNEGPQQQGQVPASSSPYHNQNPHSASIVSARAQESHFSSFSGSVSSFAPMPVTPSMNGFHSPGSTMNGTLPSTGEEPAFTPRKFQPSTPDLSLRGGTTDELDSHNDDQNKFLKLVVRSVNGQPGKQKVPIANGNPADDSSNSTDRQSRSLSRPNGHNLGEHSRRSVDSTRSYLSQSPHHNRSTSNAANCFWILENGKDNYLPLPADADCVPYEELRVKALGQREDIAQGHTPYDLVVLFNFWSHFLIRNFNNSMYQEFRHLAREDASNNLSHMGMDKLIDYYGTMLSSQNAIRERVARDYIGLIKEEDKSMSRPALGRLRSIWRNGATNMKNRKIISDLVDAELRAELDR